MIGRATRDGADHGRPLQVKSGSGFHQLVLRCRQDVGRGLRQRQDFLSHQRRHLPSPSRSSATKS
jgi:hypothetical protein